MTVLNFFVGFFSPFFFFSMQLVAGKVQKQDQQSKTLHLQTAVETVFSPCMMKQSMTEGKNLVSSSNVKMVEISQSF